MALQELTLEGLWGTATMLIAFTVVYVTQHRRFPSIKQKSYVLSTISSGGMSAMSLYFVFLWAVGTSTTPLGGHGYFMFDGLLERSVEGMARYGTIFFRSYLIGEFHDRVAK